MRFLAVGLMVSTVCLSCRPSVQSRTAGAIGCPPSEIEISDEDTSLGWGSSSDTWVATCRGQRFVCSENTVSSSGKYSASVDSDIACHPELSEAGSAPSPAAGSRDAAKPEAAGTQHEPPTTAGGFGFGQDVETIQKNCESAGKIWTADSKAGTCSGTVADVGFEALVRVDFCRKRNCRVTLEYQPKSEWVATFADLKEKLANKYGPPKSSTTAIPDGCRKEREFVDCLEKEELRLKFNWSWTTRETVDLTIGKPENGSGPVAIRIDYFVPVKVIRSRADAL
jgi:hypothetical protein